MAIMCAPIVRTGVQGCGSLAGTEPILRERIVKLAVEELCLEALELRRINRNIRDVISGGARGLKPTNNFDDTKIFYVNYTAFRKSKNASTSTSITTW